MDERGLAAASALRGAVRGEAFSGPSARARSTASALGLDATVVDALDECDFGSWAGRALSECTEDEMSAWLAGDAPHGGETLAAFRGRVGAWLSSQAALDGRAVAVTSGGVVKAAVVEALGAPDEAFWRVDASPLHRTELHAHDGRWTVARVNAPLAVRTATAASDGARSATAASDGARSAAVPSDGATAGGAA